MPFWTVVVKEIWYLVVPLGTLQYKINLCEEKDSETASELSLVVTGLEIR
jgi:hypothetical protein